MTGAGTPGRVRLGAGLALTSVLASSLGAAAPAGARDPLVLVSARPDGTAGTGPSGTFGLAVSGDGRVVAFASSAPDLTGTDGDAEVDVFVRDLDTGQLSLASTASDGTKAERFSLRPVLDADGGVVAFVSAAANLIPADQDAVADVFVKDLGSGDLALASVRADGTKGDAGSTSPSLSADGRRVAFVSGARSLSPDGAGGPHVYVKDLDTGALTIASLPARGAPGDPGAYGIGAPSLSADGLLVAFDTDAALVVEDDDTAPDVYVKHLGTGDLVLASVSATGRNSSRGSYRPSLASDGSAVAFDSFSADLSPEDRLEDGDVYVKDLSTGALVVASTTSSGAGADGRATDASLSADGTRVAFSSDVSLGPETTEGLHSWVKDLTTGAVRLVSVASSGAPAESLSITPRLSGDGRTVAFTTPAALLPSDSNGWADVYARRLEAAPPPADEDAPLLELSATPEVLPKGRRTPVSVSGSAVDAGSGLESVRLTVTDEYGRVHRVVRLRVTQGQGRAAWTRTFLLPGRSRANDPDGREFTIWATATDVSGNTAEQHVHVVAPARRGRTASDGDGAAQGRAATADRDGGEQ